MISIHALREEGDRRSCSEPQYSLNFNPRPPRGGRRGASAAMRCTWEFQSTPSARRATNAQHIDSNEVAYFNPRPPRGGRLLLFDPHYPHTEFQSTPSARRATNV